MRVAILKRRKAPPAALLDGRFHCGRIGSGTKSLTRMPQHSAPSSITCNSRRIPSRSASSRRMIITLDILTYPRKPGSILQELRSLQHDQLRSRLTIPPSPSRVLTFLSSGLVTAIHLHCLERAFEAQNSSGLVYLDRLLLSLIYHSSKDDDHARAMRDLASAQKRRCIVFFSIAFRSLTTRRAHLVLDAKEYELPKIPTTACLTVRSACHVTLWVP